MQYEATDDDNKDETFYSPLRGPPGIRARWLEVCWTLGLRRAFPQALATLQCWFKYSAYEAPLKKNAVGAKYLLHLSITQDPH